VLPTHSLTLSSQHALSSSSSPGHRNSVSLVTLPLNPTPSTPTQDLDLAFPQLHKRPPGWRRHPLNINIGAARISSTRATISELRIAVSTPSRWRWRPARPPSSSLQRRRRAGHPGSEPREALGWTAGLSGSVARGTSCLVTCKLMLPDPRYTSITHSSKHRGRCGPACQRWGGKSWSGSGSWAVPSDSRRGGRVRA
jgi:hypothetical protein